MTGRIFVTGGGSGLGRAIAIRYARAGWRVCVADVNDARGAETVGELAGPAGHRFLHCDVTRDEDLPAAARWLEEQWGGIDVVVNNAGVAQAGSIESVPLEDWRWILEINVLGVVRGCRAFVPLLRKQGGHLVNVASMAGLLDVPRLAAYNASKAAVVSISETLQHELRDDGIGVTVVCPGFFSTNLAESLRTTDPRFRSVLERLSSRSAVTAADVADGIYRAVSRGRFHVLPHRAGRIAWYTKRFLPRRLYAALVRRQLRRAGTRRRWGEGTP